MSVTPYPFSEVKNTMPCCAGKKKTGKKAVKKKR